MILTDLEIKAALSQKQIRIEPAPDLDKALSSTSIDLTLSNKFSQWKEMQGVPLRPGVDGYDYTTIQALQDHSTTQEFTLHPKHFVLAWTHEEVSLPFSSKIAARVEGKSSLARLGISVHVTAPTIHCGFEGNIQLEMYNFSNRDIILDQGMRICELIFEMTNGTPEAGYTGKFQGQSPRGFKGSGK